MIKSNYNRKGYIMNQNNNIQYINNNQNAFRCPNCGNMIRGNICKYCTYQIPNSN